MARLDGKDGAITITVAEGATGDALADLHPYAWTLEWSQDTEEAGPAFGDTTDWVTIVTSRSRATGTFEGYLDSLSLPNEVYEAFADGAACTIALQLITGKDLDLTGYLTRFSLGSRRGSFTPFTGAFVATGAVPSGT
jgi:hypothetical protein